MIDEKKAGRAILGAGAYLWPGIVALCDYFIFAQATLIVAAASVLLAALFIGRKWDWRIPACYGIALIFISIPIKEVTLATGLSTYGYWLLAAGVAVAAVRVLQESGVRWKNG